jgi:hypothetical protein
MELETLNTLLKIYGLVITVAAILMYIKQWQMANDIRALRNHFIKEDKQNKEPIPTTSTKEPDTYDKRLDDAKPGDFVKRLYDGKKMKVEAVNEGLITCNAGVIDGTQSYPKSSLGYVENKK